MKKILLLLLTVIFIFSCSNSDDNLDSKIEILSHSARIYETDNLYHREDSFIVKNDYHMPVKGYVFCDENKLGDLTILPKPGIYKYRITNSSQEPIAINDSESIFFVVQ